MLGYSHMMDPREVYYHCIKHVQNSMENGGKSFIASVFVYAYN